MVIVMSRVSKTVLIVMVVVSVLWMQAEPTLLVSENLFKWRSAFIQWSGILAIVAMSLAMVLALRLPLVEQWTQGIDKGYRIHKWLGISATLLGLFHWLCYQIPKWMIALELLTKPNRLNGSGPQGNLSGFALWVKEMRPMGLAIGEWGFYSLLLLVGVSLWLTIKYKPFRLSHRLMAVVYLLLAGHSVLLLKKAYWDWPIYWLVLMFIALGSAAAIYSLFGFVGRNARYSAKISACHYCAASQTLDLRIKMEKSWPGHKTGQFAYLSFVGEEPHPFTIASYNKANELRFLIKELGDFTTGLYKRITVGEPIEVEGPYGRFEFYSDRPQVWIGGGVGIAPFMAGLDYLHTVKAHPATYLFFCCHHAEQALCDELKQKALRAGVSLTVIDSSIAPHLSAETIARQCGDLSGFEFFFCGPVAFSRTLKQALKPYHVDVETQFHEELFMMR
ncbi:ferric reductase [Vibrio sp. V19_P1S1T109]|nr:ferric reductase [Vibrio sp. V19_P1S1T109]